MLRLMDMPLPQVRPVRGGDMHASIHARPSGPPNWEEYECSVTCSTEDPEVVIGFRPVAWLMFVKQFLGGREEDRAFDEDFLANMEICD